MLVCRIEDSCGQGAYRSDFRFNILDAYWECFMEAPTGDNDYEYMKRYHNIFSGEKNPLDPDMQSDKWYFGWNTLKEMCEYLDVPCDKTLHNMFSECEGEFYMAVYRVKPEYHADLTKQCAFVKHKAEEVEKIPMNENTLQELYQYFEPYEG